MRHRGFLVVLLYISILIGPAGLVWGQELTPEDPVDVVPAVVAEPVIDVVPDVAATSTPLEPTIDQGSSTPALESMEMFSAFSVSVEDEEEEEEPELYWNCVQMYDGDGVEFEQCGLGYDRTICWDNAGVEVCEEPFFEFYEEEEEEEQYPDALSLIEHREFLSLSLTWNGVPIENGLVPHGQTGSLGWSYVSYPPEMSPLPIAHNGTYEEMFAAADITLQIYKGKLGDSVLVLETPLSHETSGSLSLALPEEGEYYVLLSATYPYGRQIPGVTMSGQGDIPILFEPRLSSLSWLATNYDTYWYVRQSTTTRDIEGNAFNEEGETKYRMGTFLPFAFGIASITAEESLPQVSSVLFLPGIKGSRLYRPTDNCDPLLSLSCLGVKLWEPSGDAILRDLFLSSTGTSGRDDIYVKEGDILAEALGSNFYASFVNQMNALTADGTIPAWKAIAYDWRLSLDDIVSKGVKRGDKIYFNEATDSPYIEETLREMASSSPTGKVSIVAHSNGGLVTKRLMQQLEAEGSADLVDKIIFVGVPQSGAPQAMAGLLYGYGEALPVDRCANDFIFGRLCSLLSSRGIARELAEHSPMAHHLLPSAAYFSQVQDPAHAVARFTGSTAYAEERNRYGESVDSVDELYHFLTAADGGRTKPAASDTANANVLSWDFLQYARDTHESIDVWTPPSGVEVHQIAGWGMNTIAGVEFYEQRKLLGGYKEMYRPIFVEDGDGVVPIPSALMLAEGGSVKNYWVDLYNAGFGSAPNIQHGDILELANVRVIIRDLLLGSVSQLPEFISSSRPFSSGEEKLVFFLHSPLSLEIYDEDGNHFGQNADGGFDEDIPDVEYGEFGDVKYIIAPKDTYGIKLRGESQGTFSLDVQRVSGSSIDSTITIADVPTTENTVATLAISEDPETPVILKVDEDGSGSVDFEIPFSESETVFYEPEVPEEPEETPSRASSRKIAVQKVISPKTEISEITSSSISTVLQGITTNVALTDTKELEQSDGELPPNSPEATEEKQVLTASVYDAFSTALYSWIETMLYNFWDWLKLFFSRLT
ncbi:MAG TPA: hypothetical protein PK609_03735 [Candidatus Paceibacterota bacterium]|nr:hypothetical protein [Candidatus Paceibacterota bacterium]